MGSAWVGGRSSSVPRIYEPSQPTEVGILGVSKSQIKPVWDGSEFVPRMMLPLSVSYDHRVVNGADCGRFFTYLVQELGDTRRLAL